MRFTSILSVFAIAVGLIFSSCSKQDVSLPEQAELASILVGSWNVTSVKYRDENGTSYSTGSSTTATGTFNFTIDSCYFNSSFLYLKNISIDGKALPPVPIQDVQSGNGKYQIITPERFLVADEVTGFTLAYNTLNRTATSMTLYYEIIAPIPLTDFKRKQRYTYELTKL